MTKHWNARSVAKDLARRVEAGEWADQIPTYRALVEEYGVSSATVSKAVQELRVKGLVVTRPGGTIRVRPPKPVRLLVPSEDGQWTCGEVEYEEMSPFSWAARELGNEGALWRRRVLESDEEGPLCIEDAFSRSRPDGGLLGPYAPSHRIRVTLPSPEEAELLHRPAQVPVLLTLNTLGDVVVQRMYSGDRVEYVVS